jgi:hypothetical protein
MLKKVPELVKSPRDAEKFFKGDLVDIMKSAYKNMKGLGIKNIIQGDMMFSNTSSSQKKQMVTLDDESMVLFQPNTIAYAVPVDSDIGKTISQADMGIVFHTSYSGEDIKDLKKKFGVNIRGLKRSKNIWFDDANFKDIRGNILFTTSETTAVEKSIKAVQSAFKKIDSRYLEDLRSRNSLIKNLSQFNNQKIRANDFLTDIDAHINEYIDFVMSKTKSKKGKADKMALLDKKKLKPLFILFSKLIESKLLFIRKMEKISSFKTFVQDGDGYRLTGHEGFVAVSHIGKAIKLVDRLEFSRINFSAAKDWKAGD